MNFRQLSLGRKNLGLSPSQPNSVSAQYAASEYPLSNE